MVWKFYPDPQHFCKLPVAIALNAGNIRGTKLQRRIPWNGNCIKFLEEMECVGGVHLRNVTAFGQARNHRYFTVLRIRDVYPGSRIRIFHPGFRVKKILFPGSGSASKNLSIFNQKIVSSSRKNDPGCLSRIQIPVPDLDFLPIPDPGVKKAPDPGSATAQIKTDKRPHYKLKWPQARHK